MTESRISSSAPLQTGTWVSVSEKSSITFALRHLGFPRALGCFTRFDVRLIVGEDIRSSSLSAVIDLSSIHTDDPTRDAFLHSTRFFSIKTRPNMRFASEQIDGCGDQWSATGRLTLNGTTRDMTLDAHLRRVHLENGNHFAAFTSSGKIRRRSHFNVDFGMLALGPDRALLGDIVRFRLDMLLTHEHDTQA